MATAPGLQPPACCFLSYCSRLWSSCLQHRYVLAALIATPSHGHAASWHTAPARFYREFYPVFPKDEQLKVICDGGNLRLITTSRARNAFSYLAFSITTTQFLLTFFTKNRATHGVALFDCQPNQSWLAIYWTLFRLAKPACHQSPFDSTAAAIHASLLLWLVK